MSRIRKAYEAKFRTLLISLRARQLEKGVLHLLQQAGEVSRRENLPESAALTRVHEGLASKPCFRKLRPAQAPLRFFCDAGLGGLARWLRAAGYEALWVPRIDDKVLLFEARKLSATILTTDSMLMEHGLLRDRIIPAAWLPPTLKLPDQLAIVFREFGLSLRQPRCMACGGELVLGDKQTLGERIPPRTYKWLDEFFVCARCGKLFWKGTHWKRIAADLDRAAAQS